jgi:hypothetical protein
LAVVMISAGELEAEFTKTNPDSAPRLAPVGDYYQWPNNWKFTGRVGVQYFGGAQLLNLATIQPFTQPIVRLDLDRMERQRQSLVWRDRRNHVGAKACLRADAQNSALFCPQLSSDFVFVHFFDRIAAPWPQFAGRRSPHRKLHSADRHI